MESATAVIPAIKEPRRLIWALTAVGALLVIALVAVFLVLSSRITSTNHSVTALKTKVESSTGSGIGALEAKLKQQDAALTSLSQRLGEAEKQIGLYKTCVPEIMGEMNSLQDTIDVTGTGSYTVYPSPTEQVSSLCNPVFYPKSG